MVAREQSRAVQKAVRARAPAPRVQSGAGLNVAGNATRELLLTTAERLIAEQGVLVSNRQIGEAAGQSNNSVIGYHFGTKVDLVRAVLRRHGPDIEQRRVVMLEGLEGSSELGDWLACLVVPITDHMDSLGKPSWYARFLAQAVTDTALRQLTMDETLALPSMRVTAEGLMRLFPVLPPEVFEERSDMTRHVLVHSCAERERALAVGAPTPRATWEEAARGMVDALLGLWRAPVRARSHTKRAGR